jgi:hypothetical protein
MSKTITTTARQKFTEDDHRQLALLVCRRFGWDLEAATAAWRRMLQNSCEEGQFLELVGHDNFREGRLEAGLEEFGEW